MKATCWLLPARVLTWAKQNHGLLAEQLEDLVFDKVEKMVDGPALAPDPNLDHCSLDQLRKRHPVILHAFAIYWVHVRPNLQTILLQHARFIVDQQPVLPDHKAGRAAVQTPFVVYVAHPHLDQHANVVVFCGAVKNARFYPLLKWLDLPGLRFV